MIQHLLVKFAFVGLVTLGCLSFAMGVFGRNSVDSSYGYYAQSFHTWVQSGLPQFVESARRGLGL